MNRVNSPLAPQAATLEIMVGSFSEGSAWYERLLGRPADISPVPGLNEWELFPNFWIQISEGQAAADAGRLRLSVADVAGARAAIMDDLHADVSEVVTVPGVVAYCDFDDPWGNPLGLFQDLALHPATG